jgi:hypothetical protein
MGIYVICVVSDRGGAFDAFDRGDRKRGRDAPKINVHLGQLSQIATCLNKAETTTTCGLYLACINASDRSPRLI